MSEAFPLKTTVDLPWLQGSLESFREQHRSGKLHHALLVNGLSGCGKRHLAELFASLLLCDEPLDTGACGACKSCRLLVSGSHPGLLLLSPEKAGEQIKIDPVRAAINFTQHTQMKQGVRVVLIMPAENMNRNAANALLKSLEEPSPNVHFILVSDNPGKLLPTIRSRCQSFVINVPEQALARKWLAQYEPEPQKADFLLSLSEGRPLLAKFYFEEGLDTFYEEMLQGLVAVYHKKIPTLSLAEGWSKNVYFLDFWFHWLMLQSRALMSGEPVMLEKLSLESLQSFVQKLLATKKLASSTANLNLQLLIESLLIDWRGLGHENT